MHIVPVPDNEVDWPPKRFMLGSVLVSCRSRNQQLGLGGTHSAASHCLLWSLIALRTV